MKLGFVTSILGQYTLEQVITTAAEIGYECLEVACWPHGKVERRYAGVSHIDLENPAKISVSSDLYRLLEKKNISISALAYYPNTITEDLEQRHLHTAHLNKLIDTAQKLGVNMVTTFVGRVQHKTVEENLEIFKEVWSPIIEHAEAKNVKIAVENCPMLFGADQWPGGQNLMTTPAIWRKIFNIIPSKNFGINYDPSHFVWQGIDYVKPLYEFKDRIFHVHFKDIKLYKDKLNDHGIMAYPLEFMSPKIPGLGDVDWGKYVSALTDIGYSGYACVEIEDKAFETDEKSVLDALKLSYRYMRNFVI
ncbi:MAG: sugar phosphate isomerase/epimerase [Defluviitaleaceae bacterium]|nr:sugar phosphate isomerase/epimerase [Defluviitaleaceae bacterium]